MVMTVAAAVVVTAAAVSDSLLASLAPAAGMASPAGSLPRRPSTYPGGGGFPNGLPTVSTEPVVAAGSAVAVAGPALVPIALPAIVIPAIGLPVPRALPGRCGRRIGQPSAAASSSTRAGSEFGAAGAFRSRVGTEAAPASSFRAGYRHIYDRRESDRSRGRDPWFVGILLLTGAGG